LDGWVGRVDLLLLDAHRQVHHFVIRKGRFLGYDVLIPVDWIKVIDPDCVWLAMARTVLDRLPEYRPDREIAADIVEVLWQDEVIRTSDIENIDVIVRDGVVTLNGYTVSRLNQARAARDARQVLGVRDVENRLVADHDVKLAVAQALAYDPRTRGQRISIYVKHGVVTLSGKLDRRALCAAAEEVAATVPQSRGIINTLRAPGMTIEPELSRVLQPKIGQNVYARDWVIGRVNCVIINPRNRRVTELIVSGVPPVFASPAEPTLADEKMVGDRWIVIPIEVVRLVALGGVMLSINGDAVRYYPDFDLDHFRPSPASWQPPYPYTRADVLLRATEIPVMLDAD
jgi:osmotically-inducible protein OsmY